MFLNKTVIKSVVKAVITINQSNTVEMNFLMRIKISKKSLTVTIFQIYCVPS